MDNINIGVTPIIDNVVLNAGLNNQIIDITLIETAEVVNLDVSPNLIEINITRSEGEVQILQFASYSNFPATGKANYFYLAKDTNKLYRWTGTTYAELNALGYTAENVANKGIANGYAGLDSGGKVPSSQLPSYVDDVIEVANYAALPATGETGKIYITLDTNNIYRWSGSVYVEISTDKAVWGGITGTLSNQTDLQAALNAKQDDLNGTGFVKVSGTTVFYDNNTYLTTANAANTYVPYTGAVQSVDLGEFGVNAGFVKLDTTPTSTPTTVGTLFWDSANRTASLVDGDGDTTLQIGQEQRVLVHNNTGSTLTDGQVVYVTGSTGELPRVALASNGGEGTSSVTFGVVTESIANGADGFITTSGIVHGLNTNDFTEGAAIWLGSTPGTFTQTKPVAPAHSVLVGYVIKKAGGNGSIFVKIQNGYELNEIHDVLISSVANNDGLFYETSSGLWKNKSLSSVLGYTPANDANVVHTTGNETISGNKTFTGSALVNLLRFNESGGFNNVSGYTQIGGSADNFNFINGAGSKSAQFNYGGGTSVYTLPSSNGTLALTSDIPSLSGYVPTSRTITIDGVSQDLSANRTFTINYPVTSFNTRTGAIVLGSGDVTTALGYTPYNATNPANYIDASALAPYLLLAGGTMTGALNGTSASYSGNVTALSFIKTGGTSSQFLKADGTVDSSSYALSSLTISTTGPLSGGGDLSANRTLSIAKADTSTDGYLSSIDWDTFNDKQNALSGTGFVKISGTTISYDNSTYVPTSRTLTINGTALDLSADRSWTIPEYTLPTASDTVLGGVKIGAGVTITSGVISVSTNYQAPLNGTGFVKASGTTISYDNTSYTPTSRTLTINGTAFDLSADRSWTIPTYTLPTASTTVLGGVKIDGSTITIDGSGVISASGSSYTLPTATDTVLGGVKIGSGVTITSGVISVSTNYQAPLNGGTGLVYSTAGTITYDTNTYLTTSSAASTYLTQSSAASTYLPLTGGTLTGALAINRGSGNGLNVASDNVIFRSNTGIGSPRQAILSMGGGTLVQLQAKGYGADYITDFGIQTFNNSGTAFNVFYGTSAGNVGIGTSTPNGKFNVSNGGAEGIEFWVVSAAATNLIQSYNRSTSAWNGLEYKALEHIFYSSGSERMRINAGGDVKFALNITFGTTNEMYIGRGNAISGGFNSYDFVMTNYQTSGRVVITASTSGSSGVYLANGSNSWSAWSDERMKTDLKPIVNASEKVSQLRAMTGRYKTDSTSVSRSFLIAQDVLSVLPEATNLDERTGMYAVQYTDVIPLLVASIKELKAELDTLKNK